MMTLDEEENSTIDESINLGDLEALQGVVKFPVRIKCATLGWNTLLDALAESGK
jgi:nitrogen fixation NifU-like protein